MKTSADSGLRCHNNQKQRADRQKIQMNTLFLPGFRNELMKRCSVWDLLTFGNLGPLLCRRSPGVSQRQSQTADGEFRGAGPDGVFATATAVYHLSDLCCPTSLLCILIGCLDSTCNTDLYGSCSGSVLLI